MPQVPNATSATTPERRSALTIVLFVIYVVVLVGVVLFKFPFQYQLTDSGRHLNLIPFAGSSVAFEAIQFAFAIGRSDITDVLGNTLGGLVGIGLYALSARILKHRTKRVLTTVELVVTVIALAFFTFLRLHSE